MGANEEKIALIIEAYNKTKGAFTELDNSLKGISDGHKKIGAESESVFSKLKANWVAVSVAAYEAAKVFQEAWEYLEAGAKAQQAEESFRSVASAAGESADEILAAMKRAANGTVDDSDIMQKAVKGMVQGLSGDQLVHIMEAARVAARTAGTDVKTAYVAITDAVGNNSARSAQALVQFGLITRDQMKLLDASMSAGIRTVDLFALVMANAADQSKKVGGAHEDHKEKLQQLKAVYGEIKEYIGKTFWEALDKIDQWFKDNHSTIREWAASLLETFTTINAEIMRFSMLLDKVGGTMTSAGMLLFGPGAALGNKNSKAQFEKLAAANIEYENRYNATDKELQDMAVALNNRLAELRKSSPSQPSAAASPATRPASGASAGPSAKELEDQMKAALASKMREADIQQQIANLDMAEKTRDISHVDAAQKRVELAQNLLKTQEANLSLIDKEAVGGAAAWTAQQKAIEDTNKKITNFRLALRELNGDFAGGFREGLMRYLDDVGSTFQQAAKLAQAAAQSMGQAFSDLFFDLMTGQLKHLSDYFKSFLQSIARAVANRMSENLVADLIGSSVAHHHSSGLVMHAGGYVPRFHVGGLSSDEVPAILQKGEYVVSRKGVAALDRINNGQPGGAVNFVMNVENKTGTPVAAKNTGVQFDGKKFVVSVILENIENSGPLRHAIVGLK